MNVVQLRHRGRFMAAAVAGALTVAAILLAAVAAAQQQPPASASPSAASVEQEQSLGRSGASDSLTRPISPFRPAVGAPAVGAPAVGAPAVGAPAVRAPAVGAPAVGAPAVGAPAVRAPVVGPVLKSSPPVSLDVPRIGIRGARLIQLGLAKDGSIETPEPGPDSPAGWFRNSPAPGQLGAAVILGHVDSATAGPAIFFHLGTLRPGDTAEVSRADGTVAVFRVISVQQYAKARFPTKLVYGDTDHAALRLITCGGVFDRDKQSYEDNIVVYARLVSSRLA